MTTPEATTNPYATPEFGADSIPPPRGRKVRTFIIVGLSMWGGGMAGMVLGLWRLAWRWPDDLTRSALSYYIGCGAMLGFVIGSAASVHLIMNYRSASLRDIYSRRSELLAELRERRARSQLPDRDRN